MQLLHSYDPANAEEIAYILYHYNKKNALIALYKSTEFYMLLIRGV